MSYLEHFRKISQIPRPSGRMEAISDYLVDFAQSHGLDWTKDRFNNVIILKRHSGFRMRKAAPCVLQAHMDMVAVSLDGRDMAVEPICVITDGDRMFADGTSLGADDGIGMAFILDILSDSSLKCPDIQAVFTSDEESDMTGARHLDFSALKSPYIINLDSESEDEVTVSSAGGIGADIRVRLDKASCAFTDGCLVELSVHSLSGGHSGSDIGKGRANAIMTMVRALSGICAKHDIRLISLSGGQARNAIPSSSNARVMYCGDDFDIFRGDVGKEFSKLRKEHQESDPDFSVDAVWRKGSRAFCLKSMNARLFSFLSSLPDGLVETDFDSSALTSLNFGMASFDRGEFVLSLSALLRSNVDERRDALAGRLKTIIEENGDAPPAFTSSIVFSDAYPAWQRKSASRLLELFGDSYERVFNRRPKTASTHGGLECGYFSAGMAGEADIISIGPDIRDAHSAKECVSISSCERVLKALKDMLENWNL